MSTPLRRTRVKICGLRRAADIACAVNAGVDSIGLVFCARSPRHLEPDAAAKLMREVPAFVSVVALFLDPEPQLVDEVIEKVQPELLQFHGLESAEFCEGFAHRYLKAVAMGGAGRSAAEQIDAHPRACGFVFDSHAPGQIGGTGSAFDWSAAVQGRRDRMVLAGGLNPENVGRAIKQLRPWAVDVSSGVESSPGIKSHVRIENFVRAVGLADASLQDTTGS